MRWLTTLLLLALVLGGGFWLWKGDALAPQLGLPVPNRLAPVPASAARQLVVETLAAAAVVKIDRGGADPLTLTKAPDKSWTQPGNWPVRQADADQLAAALAAIDTRFRPIPYADADAEKYGLAAAQKPVVLKVDTAGKTLTLTFARPQPADASATRPTYLRVDALPEVLQLPGDVFAAVTRPAAAYRRKQLFPDADRVKIAGGDPAPNPLNPAPPPVAKAGGVLGDKYTQVRVDGPDGGFAIKRVAPTPTAKPAEGAIEPTLAAADLAAAWEVVELAPAGPTRAFTPTRDKADPAKVRAVLTAVPDLWADAFVSGKEDKDTGLDKPDRTLTVTRANGTTVTMRVGGVSRTATKLDTPPASPFGPPPQPTVTTEEFRYARLDGNPIVFEVRGDKITALFAAPADVRDATLARFDAADAAEVTIAPAGMPPIKLVKKKGKKDAATDDEKQDRWYVGDVLAEAAKVTEVLDQLGKLEARGPDALIDNPDDKKLADLGLAAGGTTITLVTEKADPPGPRKTFAFAVGKADAAKKKVNVRLAGWPRVNVVDDGLVKLTEQAALAYRGRRLFDTAAAKLETVAVTPAGGAAYAVAKPAAATAWKITQPVAADADDAKAEQFAGDISRLEAVAYVDDAPKPDDLAKKYALAPAGTTATLTFAGGKVRKLELGGPVEAKPEVYARLDGGSVFTLPKTAVEPLTAGAVALLPLQLWTTTPEKFTALELARGGEAYKLSPDGTNWKLSGPFDAPVPFLAAQPLFTALGNVKADKYEALTVTDPVKYGFDKPAVKATLSFKETKPGDPKEVITTKTLVIGNPTAAGAATRFAKLDGGPTQAVFVVPGQLFKDADKPALELPDRGLLFLDPARVSKVAIAAAAADANVTLVKDDKGNWKADGQTFATDRQTIDLLVTAVSRFPVQKLAGYGAAVKWADFGLDKPEFTLTATVAPAAGDAAPAKTHVVKLGKPAPDGGRFARVDDGPAVAVVNPRAAADLARGKLDFIDRTLFNFDPATLTTIARKMGKDDLELVQAAAGGWDLAKPAKLKADGPLVDDLADQLMRLRAVRAAAFAAKDLKPFGLDAPAAVFTLKVGAEDKVLKIGKPADDKQPDGDRFAVVDGKGDAVVGVIAGPLAKKLLAAPLKFRDRTLAKFVDADKVTLERGDRKATFAKVDGAWKMTQPAAAEAEQGDLDELVNALAKLRADDLEADKPADLKPFGLDKPEAKWKLFAGDKEVLSLLVGAKEKTGPRAFAKLEKGDLVATLDAPTTAKVLGEYRKRAVWAGVDAAQIEALVFNTGKADFVLQKLGGTWADPAKPADPFDAAKVTELLDALAGLKAERYAADQNADLKLFGLQPPQRVIVLTQKGGVTKTLHLGREEGGSGGKRVYAKVEEAGRTDVFVLSEVDTAKLTRDRAAFAGKK